MEHDEKVRQLLVQGGKVIGCSINDESISKFIIFFKELQEWNKKVSLTSLSKDIDLVTTLFIDSLACGLALSREQDQSIVDIGTGAGFPGIPLKIAYPNYRFTLIEPRLKKTAFLHHVIGKLRLEKTTVISKRVQDAIADPALAKCHDKALTRATKMEMIVPYANGLIHDSGQIILCRSKPLDQKNIPVGFNLYREISYQLPFGYGNRVLSVLESVKSVKPV